MQPDPVRRHWEVSPSGVQWDLLAVRKQDSAAVDIKPPAPPPTRLSGT